MAIRIGIWGDSITYGVGDSEKGGWVERLKVFLWKKREIDVYNRGVGADRTDDVIKRFEVECKAILPEIVIFSIGINDSVYICERNNPKVSIRKFRKNIKKLIGLAKKYAGRIIFIGLTSVDDKKTMPVPWNRNKSYENAIIAKYDNLIKEVCKENKLLFIPMFELLNKKELFDGLHPTPKGYEKMFNRIKKFLIKNKII